MKKLFVLILILTNFTFLTAQDQFERLYRANDRDNLAMDVLQTSDKGYLILSISDSMDIREYVNVTKVDDKGDLVWSKDYDFDIELERTGDLVLLNADTFAFVVGEREAELNKILTLADPTGEVVWSKEFGETSFDLQFFYGYTNVAANYDGGMSIVGQVYDIIQNNIYVNRVDTLGDIIWANRYVVDNLLEQSAAMDIQATPDSGLVVCGNILENVTSNVDIFLMKLDSLGDIQWSHRYGENALNNSQRANAVAITPDGGYVIAGGEIMGNVGSNTNGLVIKTNANGIVEWQVDINVDSTTQNITALYNVTITDNGEIVVSGTTGDSGSFEPDVFMAAFDLNGNNIWDGKFRTTNIESLLNDGLDATEDGGVIYVGNGTDPGSDNGIPYLIKLDENGLSSCEDTLVAEYILFDTIPTNSITFLPTSLDQTEDAEPEVETFSSFAIPVLVLNTPPPYCEGDPINWTFDATIDGAVSYEWSTGEATPMITVMEEGQYTVEVRVEEDYCFTLCDTALITVIGPPTVEINPILDIFCTQGFGTLQANAMGLVNTIEWSTGDSGIDFINITDPGTYSVTVGNQCGENTNTFTFTEFPEVLPQPSINLIENNICLGGTATLAGVANAAISLMWSTGENSPTIEVSETGTYDLTASNNCGDVTASIEVGEVLPEVNIVIEQNDICNGGIATLSGIVSLAHPDSLMWSTGETTLTIEVSESGDYTLSASNECGSTSDTETLGNDLPTGDISPQINCDIEEATFIVSSSDATSFEFAGEEFFEFPDTFTVNEQGIYDFIFINGCGETTLSQTFNCIALIDDCVRVPNAFTPNGDEINNDFGVVVLPACADEFTILNFIVFNRWGQKVFESQSGERWDGTHGGDPANADVYLYLIEVESEDDDLPKTFRGDVTLIR